MRSFRFVASQFSLYQQITQSFLLHFRDDEQEKEIDFYRVLCSMETRVSSSFSWDFDRDDILGTNNHTLESSMMKRLIVPTFQNPHCVGFEHRSRNARSP